MFSYSVGERRVLVDSIPCLRIEPIKEGDFPWIIHYHGWGSKKENHRFMASSLAAAGFRVLVPDCLYHGERKEDKEIESLPRVLLSNLEEFDSLFSYLGTEEVFLSGHSMGSMSAGLIFHHRDVVRAAAIINGYLSYKDLEYEVPESLRKLDPLDYLEGLGDRHLLILHGDADSSVDIEVQRNYYSQAQAYFKEGHLIMEETPRLDHYITLAMLQRSLEFFLSLT